MYVFKRVERLSQSQALPSVEFINLKEPRMDGLGCGVGGFCAVATCCDPAGVGRPIPAGS